MKKLLALAVLATTTASFAASSSAIYDIMYLPNSGTSYGFSDFNLENGEIERDNGRDTEIEGMRISQTLGHSFTDRFTVSGSFNYYDGEQDTDGVGGGKIDENGFSDLGLNARFRMIDEAIQLDVVGGAQLEISESEVERNGDIDNRYTSGGNQLNVGLQVGQKAESLQWAVLGRFLHGFERSIDRASGNDWDLEPRDAVQVRGDLLNKLAEKSLLRSHLTADFIGKTKEDDAGTLQGSQTNYEIGTEYQHLFSADLLGKVGLDYRTSDYNKPDVDSDTAWIIHFGANYQF